MGRRSVYLGGAICLLAMAFPFFALVDTKSTMPMTIADHTSGYQLAAPFAGGLAPLIASGLLGWSGGKPWPIAVYLIAMAAVA